MDSSRLEAELLLAFVLDVDRVQLYTAPDKPLNGSELAGFKGLVRERVSGRPVAHLTGRREFWNHRFLTPPGVFVPRPETETIVEKALSLWRDPGEEQEVVVLDLCTGCGNVAVSLLAELPHAVGVAVDVSPEAVEVARDNASRAGLLERLSVVCQDAVTFLEQARQRYHLVACNPPYVPTGDWEKLDRTVKDFEPRAALDGGEDGLTLVRSVVPMIGEVLLEGGWFLMEYDGDHQTAELQRLFAVNGLTDVEVLKDLAGIERVMVGRAIRVPGQE